MKDRFLLRWDDGIKWYLEQLAAPASEPLALAFVRDDHLRCVNGTAEDPYITRLISVARRAAERVTQRALVPQRWALVLERFPWCGAIELPKPPLLSIDDIVYLDAAGEEQSLQTSPPAFVVTTPSGPNARYGKIAPLYGQTWPTTLPQLDAVRISYTCGYAESGSPAAPEIPEDILHGMLLMIGELYRTRSESASDKNPALIRARDLWLPYKAY